MDETNHSISNLKCAFNDSVAEDDERQIYIFCRHHLLEIVQNDASTLHVPVEIFFDGFQLVSSQEVRLPTTTYQFHVNLLQVNQTRNLV